MEVSPAYRAMMEILIFRRKELGWSQKELAIKCGIPQSTIGRLESFTNVPSIETFLKVANQLDLKIIVTEK